MAFEVLHHEVVGADIEDGTDVGMIQRGNSAGFALEAVRESLLRYFDSDVAVEARIVGAIHLTHTPGPD